MCTSPLKPFTISRPIDVPTRETVTFVASHLSEGASVLEVGCGSGHVAVALERLGHRVTGLDADAEVVARAKAGGFTVTQASWPDFDGGPFDAVAFTRSLHHIGPLDRAIEKAREVLGPAGILLVEDFAFSEMNRAMLEWFVQVLRSRTARSLFVPVEDELVTSLIEAPDLEAVWHERHDRHELHTARAILAAARKHFVADEPMTVPYVYRYLVPVLPETLAAAAFVEDVLREETSLAENGAFRPIGRRFVGAPRA